LLLFFSFLLPLTTPAFVTLLLAITPPVTIVPKYLCHVKLTILNIYIYLSHFRSEPYDPYVPKNGSAGGAPTTTAMIQAQIDETVGIMRDNLNRVADRGERLDALQDKTENLSVSAQGFRRGANKVRKQMWWKDMKMKIIIAIAILVLLVIIIGEWSI